jgi:NAD(P)-dependent dehydrogenase (short-subunit alcohol dehydrogenase family)
MQTYQINCASYYFTSFAFLPLLAAAKTVGNYPEPGNIINIASVSGITYTSQRGQFNYNASKAGTISLSKQLACEFARRDLGVRVNGKSRSFSFKASFHLFLPLSRLSAICPGKFRYFSFGGRFLTCQISFAGYFPSGMTSVHPDQDKDEFRNQMGIPFARPGNAIDYAQTIIGIMVVSLAPTQVLLISVPDASLPQNKYQTGSEVVVDGGWLLQMAF